MKNDRPHVGWTLDPRCVAGAVEHDPPYVRRCRDQVVGRRPGPRVVRAKDHDDRDMDCRAERQQLRRSAVCPQLPVGPRVHLNAGGAGPPQRLRVRLGVTRCREVRTPLQQAPLPFLGSSAEAANQLLPSSSVETETTVSFGDVRLTEFVACSDPCDVGDGGGATGMVCGVPQGQFGAPRVPEHSPAANPQRVSDLLEVVDSLPDGERTLSTGRPAASTLLEPHDGVLWSEQGREVGQVVPQAWSAVLQHHRRPFAGCRRPELRAVTPRNASFARWGHAVTLTRAESLATTEVRSRGLRFGRRLPLSSSTTSASTSAYCWSGPFAPAALCACPV